jgi:hypothetical protein
VHPLLADGELSFCFLPSKILASLFGGLIRSATWRTPWSSLTWGFVVLARDLADPHAWELKGRQCGVWAEKIPGVFFETYHGRSLLLMLEVGSSCKDPYRRADSDAESRYGNKTSLQSQPLGHVPQQTRLVAISILQDGGCSQPSNHAPLPYTRPRSVSRVTVLEISARYGAE